MTAHRCVARGRLCNRLLLEISRKGITTLLGRQRLSPVVTGLPQTGLSWSSLMIQFAALLNDLSTTGAEQFAKFLNTASSSDASRAGRWLSSATASQVAEAAALLNQGNLDEFRELLGIGGGFWSWLFGRRKRGKPATAAAIATAPRPQPAKTATADEPLRAACPKCSHKLKYGAEHAGKRAKCPKCGVLIRLPQPTPEVEGRQ